MPLPSLYASGDAVQAWSIPRASACGAILGALAAVLRIFWPFHVAGFSATSAVAKLAASFFEIGAAALGFALLCAGAAALRNFIARRLISPNKRQGKVI
jgi:hypothetical protein